MSVKTKLEFKRVLIVDDETDVLETLGLLLSMCDVVKANNFEDAKVKLETEHFDIAILDIMGVDGYELLNIAKERNIIAVMLTAHALSPDDIVKAFKKGAASYIPKDEIVNITTFLVDVVEGVEQGKSPWWRWYERLACFFEKRFGPDWQNKEREFWRKFPY